MAPANNLSNYVTDQKAHQGNTDMAHEPLKNRSGS